MAATPPSDDAVAKDRDARPQRPPSGKKPSQPSVLKRRNFTRETVSELRSAYRLLFAEEGTFQERIDDTAQTFGDSPPVMEIIDFIRADASRPLCLPEREV